VFQSAILPRVSDGKDRPVYVISVAADLVDMHPQTLRLYERKGLIRPGRSSGKTRLYSERDIAYLREIRRLTQELGINLAGVEEIMKLRFELDEVQHKLEGEIYRLEGAIRAEFAAQKQSVDSSDPKNKGVYVISVAAELVDMHPQTLRLYERKNLIRPGRSSGKTRLYSERDVLHLRDIKRLTQELGVNLAGVEEVMRLRFELDDAQERLELEATRLQTEIAERIELMKGHSLPSSEAKGKERRAKTQKTSAKVRTVEVKPSKKVRTKKK
jgi:MerR family transcriptional regulator, heat shock protein HspR